MTIKELSELIMQRHDEMSRGCDYVEWDRIKMKMLVEAVLIELNQHGILKQG